MSRAALTLATWFGCGYFPRAPGTVGSLAGVLVIAASHAWWGAGRLTILLLTCVLLTPAIWASTRTAQIVGREDPGLIVIDEVLGVWVTLLGAATLVAKTFLAAFILFRIFDIWKPWPVRYFERLPAGFGIVCDDLAAGLYGALILYIGGIFRLY